MGPAGCGAFLLLLLLGISGAEKEKPMSLLQSICGRPAVTSGIASGRQATVGQWPWQASIRQGSLHICSATLISKKWVLTMASCFWSKDVTKYSVLVGSLQISGHPDPRMMIIPVSRIITHPDFSGSIFGALAVVELAYPVSYGPVVLPICLPSSEVHLKNTSSCWVTGWGYSGTQQYSKTSYTLKELKVPLIDLQTCNNYYQNANLTNKKEFISEATICSLIPVKHMDQCIGNRGDPLMCQVDDFWVLAGIVTWGTNCIQTNEPGIYTNISFYRSWIEKSATSFTELSATPWIDLLGFLPVMLLPLIFLGPP